MRGKDVFTSIPLLFLWKEGRSIKMLENKFQANLIKDIKNRIPGCIVMKNDSSYIQGIPDLLVLHNDKWAALECKKNSKASKRPNQEYYVNKMDDMSFARFVCPENREEVLNDLQSALQSRRTSRSI